MCIRVEKQGAAVSFTHAPLTVQHTGSPGTEWYGILVSVLLSHSVFALLYLQTIHRTDLSGEESEPQTWIIASILGTSCPSLGWGFPSYGEEKDLRTGGIFNGSVCVAWTATASMQTQCNTDVFSTLKQKMGLRVMWVNTHTRACTHTSYNGKSQSWYIYNHLACFTLKTALIVDFRTFHSAKWTFPVWYCVISVYCRVSNRDCVCVCLYVTVFY